MSDAIPSTPYATLADHSAAAFNRFGAGSYLAALVFVGTLYDVSPIGMPPGETSLEEARILQEAATEAIAANRRQ